MDGQEGRGDEGLVEFMLLLPVVFFALLVLVVHFGSFFYFPPIDGFVVPFHGDLRVEYLGRGEDQVVGVEVRLVREEILREGRCCVVLV